MELNVAESIKSKINGEVSPRNKVKAAFYGRVSTDHDSQKDSCENQLLLAKSYAKKHPNIEIEFELIDQGISGKNIVDRPKFNELLYLIRTGKIDLVITKTTSRLHRDEETGIVFRQLCIQHSVAVLTLVDEKVIDYEDQNDAFMQSIINILDAQYVQRQSEYGKTAHAQRCEMKELSAKDVCFGYTWDRFSKQILVNEEEKAIINEIFDLYVFEQKNPADIARILEDRGFVMPFNNRPIKTVSAKSVSRIIQNEKYVGRFHINQRSSKLIRGVKGRSQRIELPKEEWILVERPDLQIVDSEIFEMAQRLRESRQTVYNHTDDKQLTRSNFAGKHDFANKVKCACCGKYYRFSYADRAETKPIYRISHKGCPNCFNRLTEPALRDIVSESIATMLSEQSEAIERVEDVLFECLHDDKNAEKLAKIENEINKWEKKLDTFTTSYCAAIESGNTALQSRIEKMSKDAQERVDSLYEEKRQYEVSIDEDDIENQCNALKQAINSFKNCSTLNRERILRNLKEVLVNKDGSLDIVLTSGLTLNASVDKIGQEAALYSMPESYQSLLHP